MRVSEQGWAYAKCRKDHSSDSAFLGFIDTDEFLVINDPQVFTSAVLSSAGNNRHPCTVSNMKLLQCGIKEWKHWGPYVYCAYFHWAILGSLPCKATMDSACVNIKLHIIVCLYSILIQYCRMINMHALFNSLGAEFQRVTQGLRAVWGSGHPLEDAQQLRTWATTERLSCGLVHEVLSRDLQ